MLTSDELRTLVLDEAPETLVSSLLLERIPGIFENDWDNYRHWRREIGTRLGVDPCNVCIVGSACVGASLNPYKNLREFHSKSDIDVAIVSGYHFDVAWRAIRGTRLSAATSYMDRRALIEHRNRLVYWGCIATDKILKYLPFTRDWTIAGSHGASLDPTAGRDIKFRIYRDYDSLRSYHSTGLQSLRTHLLETS